MSKLGLVRTIYTQRVIFFLCVGSLLLSGCAQFIASAKKDFANNLSATIMEHEDPETVRQAIPTYLILIDSLIRGDSENANLLISGSRLYGAYASVFVDELERKRLLSSQSFDYAKRAVCIKKKTACTLEDLSYYKFEQLLQTFKKEEAELLFTLGSSWAGKIQANSSDWNAVAELPKVKSVIARVLTLDETISNGDAHLYMAVMESFLPPAMGGKPDVAKTYFESALRLSDGKNLMALLLYAEKYARLVFDKELHDSLLNRLLDTEVNTSDMTLINTIARAKAKILLEESNDYF